MGKGDKKSKRGKISKGTFGVRRKRKKTKAYVPAAKPQKQAAPKKVTEEPKATPKKTAAKKPAAKKAAPKKPAVKKDD